MKKHMAKKKTLYLAFVDLEKAFDRVPRDDVGHEEVRCAAVAGTSGDGIV